MKYRQALVFSYQRFENALISIIYVGSFDKDYADFKLTYFFAKTGSRWNY